VPSAEVPAGTITQVFQSGYMIEERVLRPAMVAVSKGGPKPQPPAEAVAAEPAPKASENGSESPPSN
jgi:molecular chaperone GrpE